MRAGRLRKARLRAEGTAAILPGATLSRLALLAQLVEHFHGKEGVIGSSPMEGSFKDPANPGSLRFRAGCMAVPRGQ